MFSYNCLVVMKKDVSNVANNVYYIWCASLSSWFKSICDSETDNMRIKGALKTLASVLR